jgi:hypothetical protein
MDELRRELTVGGWLRVSTLPARGESLGQAKQTITRSGDPRGTAQAARNGRSGRWPASEAAGLTAAGRRTRFAYYRGGLFSEHRQPSVVDRCLASINYMPRKLRRLRHQDRALHTLPRSPSQYQ